MTAKRSESQSPATTTPTFAGDLIDGAFVHGTADATWSSADPAQEFKSVLTAHQTLSHVDAAISAARAAQFGWAELSDAERATHLARLKSAFDARVDEMAHAIVSETGKPHREALGEAKSLGPRIALTLSAGLSHVATVRPHGVAGEARAHAQGVLVVLGPYNYPAHLVNAHVIPALATGNTVVIKPTEFCPLVGQVYAQCLIDAALPPGVVNLVQGNGSVGQALVAHKDSDGVLFTGSYRTGRAITEACLDHPHKIVALEMGGKNCAVVLDDANLSQALPHILQGAFLTTGQRCTATSRVLVAREVKDALLDALAVSTAALAPGDPWDNAAAFGPLANRPAFERFVALRDGAKSTGVEVVVEGKALEGGAFVTPSLHLLPEGKTEADGYLNEELFGPDICLEVIDDVDHAIARVNESAYGLSNAVFTNSESRFERFFARTKSGLLNWNRSTNGASGQLPFGGVGKSGNQRPAGAFATRYTSYPVALMKGDVAAKAAGFDKALALGEQPLTLDVEHLAHCHAVEARFERVRIPLDDIHGAALRFPLHAFKDCRIAGESAASAIAATLDESAALTAAHLVVHVPAPAAVPDFLSTLDRLLGAFADENLAHVATRVPVGVKRPEDGKMPRSAMHLERMYKDDFIPRERKTAVVDHGRTVGPYLTSVDDNPLSILDAASQIASLGLGFSADAFLKALDEGHLSDALLANHPVEDGVFTPAQRQARAHVDAYAAFLLEQAGGVPAEHDAASLSAFAPRHVTFAGGGSEANERAYDLCRVNGEGQRAGGTRILAFEGSFHGRTFASLHATYNPVKRAPFEIAGYEATFLPFPAWTDPRDEPEVAAAWLQMWEEGKTPDDGGDPLLGAEIHALCAVRDEIEREDAEKVCCVLIEPFQGEGGDNYATARFFNGLRAVTRRAQVPLVFDEVQGGFGLAGPFFWHRHFHLRNAAGQPEFPDCVTVAKKAQVGACVSRWEDTRPGAVHVVQAQRGHIHAVEVNKLDAGAMEEEVRGRLYRFALQHDDLVENPRNMGFAFAFDLPSKHQANQIIAQRFYRGYMAYIAGERTVRFRLTAAWTPRDLDTLFGALQHAIEALRAGGPEWTAPAWVATPAAKPAAKALAIDRSRLQHSPRAVLAELVRLPAGAAEMVVEKTRSHLEGLPVADVDHAVGELLGDPGLRDAPAREVLAALAECSLEIESADAPDDIHAKWSERLGMSPARLLIEALSARVIEITPADWDTYKDQIVAIENATYEDGRRETEAELKALVFADGAVSFLAMRRTESGPRAVAYAFGAALENFNADGPAHDVTRDEGATFYSSNITVAPGARGAGLGQRLKRAQAQRVNLIEGPSGARRYQFMTGRNRVGHTTNMGVINTKLGAYTVEHFHGNQYGDVSGQAVYYRIPTQRPRVPWRSVAPPATKADADTPDWIDWGSSVQAPLGEAPDVLKGALQAGAFTGPVGTKLTLSNFVSPEVARYCELLRAFAPKGLEHVYFTSGRDELVDKGLRALRVKRPKAQRAITFDRQYFGTSTAAARSLTCDEGQAQPFGWYPWPRVPHPAEAGPDAALGGVMAAINEVGPDGVLGIIVELVGERTGHVMSEAFLKDLDKVRQDTGVPLIFVETASGLGRTGSALWQSDALAVKPDHVWWFAGGQLGHIFTNDAHYVGKPLTLISTWDGDEICAIRTREHLLAAHRACLQGGEMAKAFAAGVQEAAESAGFAASGAGLWQVIDAKEKATALIDQCRAQHLHVVEGFGGRVVLSPPLSLTPSALATGLDRLKAALKVSA